ncbi:stAR-related lipid transfer protein 9 isoform X2 [Coturnix japonica]|uniref:stAR-related lipid transfer protein 9 isoform X2 n=1 Tax=Coturnix japonica TaxID=93934 RepID=UPI000777F72D|nr:stAR-related lipid transfer protein 9 isoform X2 [Coturnix japonica]
MANVKVAVRVRPLSKRESAEGGRVIVEVDDKVTTVRNVKVDSRLDGTWDSREKTAAFCFDYCYWSVDPEDPKYASQEMVFQDLGTSVLSGAFRGYNICLFAYGQTGSGKTYTMMGTPASIGLTPRICEGLFSRKDDYSDQTASCRVKVSFLEIYNERVRDLLKQSDHKKPYTLRVREHPETGPYVQGLSQHLVTDYKQVVELLEEGIAKRITAATHIHNASSRSHAIFTIHYTQAILENNLPSEIASKINLVDLAGSERADPSYCKDRITEGANINKSLVTLGIVISTLAQNSQIFSSCQSINTLTSEGESSRVDSPSTGSVSGSRRPAYIPYRDSILTWLLKDSLGGNSKTIMIATISPASSSYNETMSTLRYASNAKNIINKPRVNEDANVKLIRELREEIDRLKTLLMSFELRNSSPWSDDRDGNLTELVLQNEMKIEQLTKDWTSKWMDRKAIMDEYSVDINKEKAGVTIDSSLPHLMAMDDDILSTGVVLYHLREGTTKIGRSDSDQDQDIVLKGRWIEKDHCMIDNNCGIVTLRPLQGAYCTVNGCEVTGSCRLSQGALVVLGKSHKFRFNHPAEAAVLRQRRSINDVPPILSCGALDWLNLDGSHTHSPHYILSSLQNKVCTNCKEKKSSPEVSIDIDTVHEEYKKKLKEQEAFHRKQIQQQQLYVEDLKQQILRGQVKAERELENDQALINQQILENQQWLINESNQLAALQQQQREFAVQTESTLYAEAEVQSSLGLEISPSLLQQNKKRLVQLELLRRCSLKKAERNIRRKKVKFQLERIVKKQKLLEAKQNLEQLEANCWLSEVHAKQPHIPNENTVVHASVDHQLQKRRRSLGSSYSLHGQHSFCNLHLPQVPSCLLNGETISKLSTSSNIDQCSEGNTPGKLSSVEYCYRKLKDFSRSNDLNDKKGISFLVQMHLSEKQKVSSFGNKKGAERDSNDSAVMAHTDKNDQKMEKLGDSPGQAGCQKQTSKGSSPDHCKEKNEPETFITGTRMTKTKVLGDLSQPANSCLEQTRAQVSNKKTRMDINAKGHSSSPENVVNKIKTAVVYGNLPSPHPNQAAKNLKTEPTSALQSQENSSVEHQEFLMVATSVGNLTKMNTQAPLSYVEKKWHSAELLSAGISKTATDVLGNWQEDEENEISDTDSTYSVDSLSCAYAKAFTEKLKQDDVHRNKCLANPEDSESDDSQMSQDSLVEKENKAKRQNKSQFQKLKAHRQPAKLYKSRSEHRVSSLVTSHTLRRRLGEAERSFSLDSLGDGEEVPTEDPVEESKSDSSDEVPAEIFWKLQTPRPPTVQTEGDHESKICSRDPEGTNYNLKLTSSFYLDTKQQPASNNACKQFLEDAKVSFAAQERSFDRRLYYASGNPLLTTDAWSSYDSKVEISSPRITAPSSHEHLEFQDAHFYSLSKPTGWLKKDDLKQSAAEVSFVSGSKQINSITHLPLGIKEINTSFSSDTSEVPLPETTAASGGFENEECTNTDENSSLESQDITSTFVSSLGPSSSFVHISVKPDYYEHSRANHPEQEQINESSTYRSTTECTQAFSCLENFSTAECLSPIPRKEEDSLPTTHLEPIEDHKRKKPPFVSVLPVHILEQRNSCVEADLEDSFLRTIEKDDLDDDCNNSTIESKVTDSATGSTSVGASTAGSSTELAYNVVSAQASEVQQVHFGNCVQLFPRREAPACCDESFFLNDLTNKCSPGSSHEHQVLAGQGAKSTVVQGLLRSRESNMEAMQDTDYEQIPAEAATENTDFSLQKITYRCNPLVIAYSATPIEMCEKEKICMETSTDSLSEIVSEEPSLREKDEHEPKDEDLSSLNHYEFKSKPVSNNYSYGHSLADGPVSCLSQHMSENSTLCVDSVREESSESKKHSMLNSQVVDEKEFSSKYKNLLVNEVSYITVNVNGQDTESFPAAVCENTGDLLPESNSSIFYKTSAKANFFQSASETEDYDTLLEHVTIVKGDCDATSNHAVEARAAKDCSVIHSNRLCMTSSSASTGEKNNMCKMTDSSVESDATILLETETNKFLTEAREEKEALFESDCPEDILLVEDHFNSELGGVFEYNTDTLGTVSQEERLCIDKESKFLRNPEADPEETVVPYQNIKANTEEVKKLTLLKLNNSTNNPEKNGVEMKSIEIESVPDYPVTKVQSVTADRSGENFKGIGLSQNPKKPTDIVDSGVQCEFYTKLHLRLEEAEKDELQVVGTGVEHSQELKALVHSDSFFQKEESEEIISVYSPELSASLQSSPSATHSHRIDFTQNAQGLPDACEGLLQMNRTGENVFNTEDIDTTELITDRQGNILEKTEEKIDSSNLTERYMPHCLPHEDSDQENKVNVCEVTGCEEQVTATNTEGMFIMNQEDIHTDENVLFTEESPALHQMFCNGGDKEEILNQFKIPERYLTPSGLGENILSVDDSQHHSPLEMNEDGDSEDSATDTRNTAMEDINVYDYSVDDNISNDQYRPEEESKSLHIKENSHMYMSCSTQYPELGASENLSVVRRLEICGQGAIGSGIVDEKAHLNAVDKTEKQMFLDNREEVELIVLQNLTELFPESKDSCNDDNRLSEILRGSQWLSTSFSTNNGDNSKQHNSAATLKSTKNIHKSSVKDPLCPSISHLLCLEVSGNSQLVQDVPTALKSHTKPSSGNVGTEAVLLYYETLMENEASTGTLVKTVNKKEDSNAHSDKVQSKNEAFLQNRTTKNREEEDLFVFTNDCSASGQPVNENSFSWPWGVGSHEPEMVELKQAAEGNSFSSELDCSEDTIEDINSHEEHSVDLMINKILKDCFNSTEGKGQEERDTVMPDKLLFNNSSLLSSSEKETREDMGEKTRHSLQEISSQNVFENINTAETELHSGSSSQCDNKEKCLNTHYTLTSSNNDNTRFSDVRICQSEPRCYQGHETSKDCCVDYPEITASENTSTLSARLPDYKKKSCTHEHSAGLLNSPRSFTNDLIDSSGEKCKNNTVLSEETKYFESESTVLSAFSDASQNRDEKDDSSAVTEATDAQSDKITEEAVGTDQEGKPIRDSFQNCDDTKENKMPEYLERYGNTFSVTLPESGVPVFQSLGKAGSKESKCAPSYFAENTPSDILLHNSKNISVFNACLLDDSKSPTVSQLEVSLQDTFLTEQASSGSADLHSVKDDFPQAFAEVNHPSMRAFSESSPISDRNHGETGTCDRSHTSILKHSPLAVLQMQDTQSDKSVVFDEPVHASGIILLSLAKANKHYPVSDTNSASYENSAVDVEPVYGSNCQQVDNDTEFDQHHWSKVPAQKACTEHAEKVPDDNNAGSNIHADSFSTRTDDIMGSERQKFSLMNNESTPLKFLPTNHGLPSQESKLVEFRSRRPCPTTHSAKNCKTEHRPYLQSHRLSAPALAVFSDLDDTFKASSLADSLLYSASRSLQDLNMSVEPPSPTEDDLHVIERFSKQESKNILQVKSKPRFHQRMTQTKKIANCDPKNLQNYAARTRGSQSLKDSAVHSPSSLLPTAHSSVGAKENIHSKSSSVAQCSEGRVVEAGYQPGAELFSQDSKDAMHFSSSDINPYIHPWQQEESCKIGWKQYVFGSASDVSCHQMPLNLDNRKVTRCSSVDNGLNSQNSPFHSHLSSYATAKVLSSTLSSIEGLQGWDNARPGSESTYSSDSNKQYSNASIETLETNPENDAAKLKNPSAHPGNSSVQVDEIVLLYPSESERSSKKSLGITCEQGTQTVATARYKRQRRHQRSYTDVSARRLETNRDLFQQHSSWTSMQNLSMHLSQLIQNTSELLGNLSQQNIIDNEQSIKIYQRRTEEGAKATGTRSDSCTQTTTDIGTQTEILEESQNKHEEKRVQTKSENELRPAKAVNCDFNGIGADTVDKVPKRKEKTFSLEERSQEGTEMRNLGNTDFHDSLDSILEDSFMCLPLLHRTSTLDFQKPTLNTQQHIAPASARVSIIPSSSVSSGQDDSSCTVVSSPTSSTFQSPSSYVQDKRSVNELEVPAERKLRYKNTLLVDRASSPILTLSASPKSQNTFSKPFCPIKEPLGYSSDASNPLHSQRKQRSGPQSSMEPHVDNFSQTETDSECSIARDSRDTRNVSGSFLDKKAAKKLLGNNSKAVEQQHRLTVGTHTTICAKRLYHSSSTLEVSGRTEFLTDDVRDPSPLTHSLHCMYVTGRGRSVLGGIGHENYVGNSDTALTQNHSPPDSDLLFNPKHGAACSSQANINESSEPLVGAASLQFHDLWKNENSCSLLSDVSDVQISLQNDNTNSITETECDTEIPLKKSTTLVKPYRPRSYSLRDLPIHNKFSNWCGVKGSPPPSSLSLSGSATDLHSQAESKPGSQAAVEIEGKSELWGSRSREIERLQRERAQIMSGIHLDLHQHPLTVELTEAKLNYGIGETDALLRVLQSGTADDLMAVPVKQQLYERHMRTIETLRKEREKRLQRYHRSRSLSPQKHLSLLQTLDASYRDLDLPSRRREYLQQLRRDVVENTRVQEPKRRSIQHPSEIELMLRDYQRAREETKTEIARARDKLRERAEQEKRRIREQILAQLQKEEARLKTLASTSTLCTESSLSLSSGPTSGYNSSNTATYTASKLSSWEGQFSSGSTLLSRDTRGRSAVRNSQLFMIEQLQKDSTLDSGIEPPLPSDSISCRFTHGLTISVSSSSTQGYQDLSKHILANATTEVMAACSHNLRNLYTCQAAAGWKYQCTEKEVLVYYKVFPSATKHGFLGAGVIERPLAYVWGLVRDPGKRHLYDRSINTARIHRKITSQIQLVYLVTDTSLCYLQQPRDFCCITVEAKEKNLSVLAIQSVYDASMPHPCKDVVRGEILPSAWILEPDVVNGRDITRVIYMAQVDLGAPAIPARLLSSIAKRQPLVIARLAHFLAS